jgi:hypothetical protein
MSCAELFRASILHTYSVTNYLEYLKYTALKTQIFTKCQATVNVFLILTYGWHIYMFKKKSVALSKHHTIKVDELCATNQYS